MRGSGAIQYLKILPRVHYYAMLIMSFLVNSGMTYSRLTGKCRYCYTTSEALSVSLSENKAEHSYQENIKVPTFQFFCLNTLKFPVCSAGISNNQGLNKHALQKKKSSLQLYIKVILSFLSWKQIFLNFSFNDVQKNLIDSFKKILIFHLFVYWQKKKLNFYFPRQKRVIVCVCTKLLLKYSFDK